MEPEITSVEISSGENTNDTLVIMWCDQLNLDQYDITYTTDLFLEDMHLERSSGLRVTNYRKELVVAGRYTFRVFAVYSNSNGYSTTITFLAGPGKYVAEKHASYCSASHNAFVS